MAVPIDGMKKRTVYVFDAEWTDHREPAPAWVGAFEMMLVYPEEIEETFERLRSRVNAHIADKMIGATIEANEYLRQTLRINRVFLDDEYTGRYEFGSLLILKIAARLVIV